MLLARAAALPPPLRRGVLRAAVGVSGTLFRVRGDADAAAWRPLPRRRAFLRCCAAAAAAMPLWRLRSLVRERRRLWAVASIVAAMRQQCMRVLKQAEGPRVQAGVQAVS